MSVVIAAEKLSKRYTLGHQNAPSYSTLRDTFSAGVKHAVARVMHPLSPRASSGKSTEDFWALRDVSFEFRVGDRVGIVGRNGAGKSTLLKVLSRITEPTSGRVTIRGRVASLLEVGTGFHPELTGRENIFLNGAILGMSRIEIARKFDEIVAFAEVEKFLDTPVKRYSSGMYVRLAFAVAAHLEPEILIVDEVLAVGDAQFQKKCLGKMEQIGNDGRTIIFVSHNVHAVRKLCTHAALLESGRMTAFGEAEDVTDLYFQKTNRDLSDSELADAIARLPVDPSFEMTDIALMQSGHPVHGLVNNGLPLDIRIDYRIKESVQGMRVFIDMQDDQGIVLFRSFHDDDQDDMPTMHAGTYSSTVTIPANLLAAYPHLLCVKATVFNDRYNIPEEGICIPLQVEQTGHSNPAYLSGRFVGRFALPLAWRTTQLVEHEAQAAAA